ncbi:hypothetical protein RD110_05435 [Rhodoferax koreense]|uniref:DUF4136 domain-containing protein n=1 Tax=Rhodoferax koreensis TaxID=1842727 RepID=A0A1P8K3B9_9BURK|nr:hypothetical protein RD110_05435 [Rhodoferax koreense]
MRSSFAAVCAITAAIALSGCATAWRVDSDVQTFSSLPATATTPAGAAAPSPATFRFERLPLQQATPAQQAAQTRLEAMALPALTQVGMVQDDAHARYNVQVSAQLQQVLPDYWDRPAPGYWWPRTSIYYGRGGGGAWWPYYGGGFGYGFYSGWDERAYRREVSVVMRDAATGQVVYETRAANLGRWPVDRDVLPLMFSAALSGFPQPPAGLRRVNITVAR